MSVSIASLYKKLSACVYSFDATNSELKASLLATKIQIQKKDHTHLILFHDLMLYVLAHPDNDKIYELAKNQLEAFTKYFKSNTVANEFIFENSGLPNTHMYSRFTHDFTQWLANDKTCEVSLYDFEEEHTPLYQILKLSLSPIEQEITSSALPNEELMDSLQVKKTARLAFLLNEFSKFNEQATIKDHLWESAKPLTNVHFKDASYSRTWNKIDTDSIFYHQEIIKRFDFNSLLNTALPKAKNLTNYAKTKLIDVIKKNLVLSMRETDPATYIDESSLRFYDLERGINVAIFGMQAYRQFPFCSYIGYTLFKNGYPISYGGSWISGSTANFGINIFEPYRGGESGFTLIQLLRVYRQAFGVNYFEIEPYQFGQDNPDGIKSGAFWFYYRFGFRPVDKKLAALASKEFEKIQQIKGYRSSEDTLIKFTESNLALKLSTENGLAFSNSREVISKYIAAEYAGNRLLAKEKTQAAFTEKTGFKLPKNKEEQTVFENYALLVAAYSIVDKSILDIIVKIIQTKSKDAFAYNLLLKELLIKIDIR